MSTNYVAVLLSESSSDSSTYVPLYNETIAIVAAESPAEAQAKALNLGRRNEMEFLNKYGEKVTWRFRKVVDVAPLLAQELCDGTELYSRHFRDIHAYEAFEPLLRGELD